MSDILTPAHFANTILVPCESGQAPTLQTVGVIGQPRKKRPHSKSRQGCVACKRRRVKCDERLPCSSCVKRNIQCLQPYRQHVIAQGLSTPSIHFGIDTNPQISLLHLELFHHWDKETRSTLTFPQVWPVVMQRAFHEDFIMSAMLCVAAMHLTALCPQSTKYPHASMQLMAKTIRLFRQNLSRPLTKDNCEALMGTALLINYISWFDIGFLDGVTTANSSTTKLDLAQDQLFLLTPGIVQVWFQAMPVFIDEGGVFAQIIHQNPRLTIEEALVGRGEDPARFVEPLMRIWDDPRYQTRGCTDAETAVSGPTSYAWRLLLGLEMELSCHGPLSCTAAAISEGHDGKKNLVNLRDAVTKVTTKYTSTDHPDASAISTSQSARSSFENIARRMSPLLCCASLKSASNAAVDSSTMPHKSDIEQLFYGFPILCCGPFVKLLIDGDSRALVLLFHFYRAARVLLAPERCWWACVRSCVMEELIVGELKSRNLELDDARNYVRVGILLEELIMTASVFCFAELIQLILEHQALINVGDSYERKLIYLTYYNSLAALMALKAPISDFSARDRISRVPFHYAVLSGQVHLVDEVLRLSKLAGIEIDVEDRDNWTPLHWAARASHALVCPTRDMSSHEEIILSLIRKGAEINAHTSRPEWSGSVIDITYYHNADSIATLLLPELPHHVRKRWVGHPDYGVFYNCCLLEISDAYSMWKRVILCPKCFEHGIRPKVVPRRHVYYSDLDDSTTSQ